MSDVETAIEVVELPKSLIPGDALAGLDEESPAEVMAEMRNRIDFQKGYLKDLDDSFKEIEAAWIKKHGPLTVGDQITRRLKFEVKVNNPDRRATLEAAFEACDGDMEKVASLLSTTAFKPAATANILGDEKYRELFTETVVENPETKKPKKSVQTVNERFLQTIIARKEASRAAE